MPETLTLKMSGEATGPAPSLPVWRDRANSLIARGTGVRFAILALFAFAIRAPIFGEWNYDIDDEFYWLVGQRLLSGDLLYVDIWDRKGPVLYLVYAGMAAISSAPVVWHIGATLFALAGAWGIAAIAQRLSGPRGALMAGIAYLAMLVRFGGATGQAPVIYNVFVIALIWCVITRLDTIASGRIDRRVLLGMLSGGLAVATKQSAAIECAFVGLFVLALMAMKGRASLPRLIGYAAAMAIAGALPLLLTGLYYWQVGQFGALWHALVESNFGRLYEGGGERLLRFLALFGQAGFLVAFAVLGVIDRRARGGLDLATWFILGWCGAAIFAVAIFPNIYSHYGLPLLPPLAILAAEFFAHRRIARLGLAALVLVNLWYGGSFDLVTRWRAHGAQGVFANYVRAETPGKRLLVWGNPSLLYAEIGAKPPTRLAFPRHLYDGAEAGASGIDEVAEVRRILRERPETVVVQSDLLSWPLNTANTAQVDAYVHHRCAKRRIFTIYDRLRPLTQTVYSRCAG